MSVQLAANQRAYLRSLANQMKPVIWIGKQGLAPAVIDAIDDALEADELIKVKVLEGAPMHRKEAGPAIAEATGCALVQTIGRVLILFRPSQDKPTIELPPAKGT